jgi:hypothetical protein
MSRGRKVHRELPDRFYDDAGRVRIPNRSWTVGDKPIGGKVHLDIYVFGNAHGGCPRDDLDGCVTLDEGGTHPLDDPQGKRARYRNQQNFNNHDGNNSFIRWRIIKYFGQKDSRPLLALANMTVDAIRKAKNLATVKRGKPGAEVLVHNGKVGAGCTQGRHRSTVVANCSADFARSLGATAQVHYLHLWRGIVPVKGKHVGKQDERGRCGCHLGAYMCQHVSWRTASFLSEWCRDEVDADKESDATVERLLKPLREELKDERVHSSS